MATIWSFLCLGKGHEFQLGGGLQQMESVGDLIHRIQVQSLIELELAVTASFFVQTRKSGKIRFESVSDERICLAEELDSVHFITRVAR